MRRAIIQAEAAKEWRQGNEAVRKKAIREMQLQCEARGGRGRTGTVWDALWRYIVRPSPNCVKPSSGLPHHSKSRNLKAWYSWLPATCLISPHPPAPVGSLSFIAQNLQSVSTQLFLLIGTVLYWWPGSRSLLFPCFAQMPPSQSGFLWTPHWKLYFSPFSTLPSTSFLLSLSLP